MTESAPNFHYPSGLKLTKRKPMVEAWLEVRWNLVEDRGLTRDPQFAFALGRFRDEIQGRFPSYEELDAVHLPEDITPYVVRYRFRVEQDDWPLLQIGPGVATLNFLSYDRWGEFEHEALFLRKALLSSYSSEQLKISSIALRYRDVEEFDYSEDDILEFLEQKLNIPVQLPAHVPGVAGRTAHPKGIDLRFSFDLAYPVGDGSIQLVTGHRNAQPMSQSRDARKEVLVIQLEVMSSGSDAPDILNQDQFSKWLNAAHDVLHEWFFSFTDGPLWDEYGVKR